MSEIAPRAELMRSLGRLVRGLSALFWGMPAALVVCVWVATNEWVRPVHMAGPIVTTGLLFYGLHLISSFQHQERVWRDALDRAKLLSLINTGLSPFIYWFNRMPDVSFFNITILLLIFTGILFLFNINYVLQRLAEMLPDETLRAETRVFSGLNVSLLSAILFVFVLFYVLVRIPEPPPFLLTVLRVLEVIRNWFLVFLILLPLAMTMSLIWKIKEVVFASVFSHEH
jgi:hypothetical protein